MHGCKYLIITFYRVTFLEKSSKLICTNVLCKTEGQVRKYYMLLLIEGYRNEIFSAFFNKYFGKHMFYNSLIKITKYSSSLENYGKIQKYSSLLENYSTFSNILKL